MSGPAESLRCQALSHWLGVGLDSAAERLAERVGSGLKIRLEHQPRADRLDGWCQAFRGPFCGQAQLLCVPEEEVELIRAMVETSSGPLEPSRELVEECANVVLNGTLMSLSRALGVRLASGLPKRRSEVDLVPVFHRQIALRWPSRTVRADLRLALDPAHVNRFEVALRRSLSAFMEALAWPA